MTKRPIDLLAEQQGYIKDTQLEEYLEGKNLLKPDTLSESESAAIKSRYEAGLEAARADREKSNASVKRSYRLKK